MKPRHIASGLVLVLLWALAAAALTGQAAEVIPPKPARYFNDYAGVTSAQTRENLNRRLEDLEKTDSTQVVVAIFQKMQSDSSVQDYSLRVAQSWGVGQQGRNNGAILFVFIADREMFLQVGYGLEGAIPDITAKDITENRIKPHFRNGDFDAGLAAGVEAIIQAARGEYQGTGRTAGRQPQANKTMVVIFVILLLLALISSTRHRRHRHLYGGPGRRGWGGPVLWTGGGGGGGGWSGGGGFSGGGGSFGGGGAGSKW